MTIKQRKLFTEYLNYFLWFLEGKLTLGELDYMLSLRDRLEKSRANLGDLDTVWKSQPQKMLKNESLFDQPLSNHWWWKKSKWERLAKSSSRPIKQRMVA